MDLRLYNAEFSIVEETADYIVVDKPAHQMVHPSGPGNPPTLWDGLRELLAFEIANGSRLSIITRLDRETSGVVLVAKNKATAREFGRAPDASTTAWRKPKGPRCRGPTAKSRPAPSGS